MTDPLKSDWTREALDKVYRELEPGDHFMHMGEHEFHTVPARLTTPTLRTNSSSEENTMNDTNRCPAPNAYAADIARLRIASGTSEYHRVLAEQVKVIEAAAAETTAANDAAYRALADEPSNLADYRAPNGYAAGIRALQREKK
jgi:hypothetical protein